MSDRSRGFLATFGKIAVTITCRSRNRKTGDMAQLWIGVPGILPSRLTDADQRLICGHCPAKKRWCYVSGQALHSVWTARNRIELGGDLSILPRLPIRLGAHGDPSVLPTSWLFRVVDAMEMGHTGYTHLWRTADPDLRRLLMASADLPEDAKEARATGWRTFRILLPGESPASREVLCQSLRGKTCRECLLCSGGVGPNVAIPVHGPTAHRYTEWRREFARRVK